MSPLACGLLKARICLPIHLCFPLYHQVLNKHLKAVSQASLAKAVAWLCRRLSALCASSLSVKNNNNNNRTSPWRPWKATSLRANDNKRKGTERMTTSERAKLSQGAAQRNCIQDRAAGEHPSSTSVSPPVSTQQTASRSLLRVFHCEWERGDSVSGPSL